MYLAGEASADTRALLEDYLRAEPALAAEVRAQAEKSAALLGALGAAPAPDQFFAFGLAFALMPFACGISNGEISWIMLRDNPKQAALFLVASAYCWISRYIIGRRETTPRH